MSTSPDTAAHLTIEDMLAGSAREPKPVDAAVKLATVDIDGPLSVDRAKARLRVAKASGGALEQAVARRQLDRAERAGQSRLAAPAMAISPLETLATSKTPRPTQEMTAADVEFIRRLPLQPKDVAVSDAVEVVKMYRSAANLSDRRLLASIAEPLIAHHGREAAKTNAAATVRFHQTALAQSAVRQGWPDEVLDMLAESIRSDPALEALTVDEARGRARDELDRARSNQAEHHRAQVAAATAELAALRDAS